MLRELGQDAYLVPHPHTAHNQRVEQYKSYDAPEAPAIIDEPGNVVVYPETYVYEMSHVKRARRMCWWLSIDNSLTFMAERMWHRSPAGLLQKTRKAAVPYARMWKNRVAPTMLKNDRDVVHLAQSSMHGHSSRRGSTSSRPWFRITRQIVSSKQRLTCRATVIWSPTTPPRVARSSSC